MTFIIIIYGAGGGDLGTGCNETLAGSMCPRSVTNARSAVFTLLTFVSHSLDLSSITALILLRSVAFVVYLLGDEVP